MYKLLQCIVSLACLFSLPIVSRAQSLLDLPRVSQHAKVTQRIGITNITIDYNRPLVNGRKIWGGLEAYGKVWRAGANENTTIDFSDPVRVEGKPLPREHGGPVRMITPQLYAWKGSKWIQRIEFLTHDRPGFWETRGYSDTAHPWRDDRYS